MPNITFSKIIRPRLSAPIIMSLIIIVWTVIVSPYTAYGDDWAMIPVLIMAVLILIWHIYLLFRPANTSRLLLSLYAVIHVYVLITIVGFSLVIISKDSL